MKHVSLYEAKTQLSALVEAASLGSEVIISKNGKPKARLVAAHPIALEKKPRKLGQWATKGPQKDRTRWLADWKADDDAIAADFEKSVSAGPKGKASKGRRK